MRVSRDHAKLCYLLLLMRAFGLSRLLLLLLWRLLLVVMMMRRRLLRQETRRRRRRGPPSPMVRVLLDIRPGRDIGTRRILTVHRGERQVLGQQATPAFVVDAGLALGEQEVPALDRVGVPRGGVAVTVGRAVLVRGVKDYLLGGGGCGLGFGLGEGWGWGWGWG